jgi:hypothetical protein
MAVSARRMSFLPKTDEGGLAKASERLLRDAGNHAALDRPR